MFVHANIKAVQFHKRRNTPNRSGCTFSPKCWQEIRCLFNLSIQRRSAQLCHAEMWRTFCFVSFICPNDFPFINFPKLSRQYFHLLMGFFPDANIQAAAKPTAPGFSPPPFSGLRGGGGGGTLEDDKLSAGPRKTARRAEHHSCPGSKVSPQETSFAASNLFPRQYEGEVSGGRNVSVDCWGFVSVMDGGGGGGGGGKGARGFQRCFRSDPLEKVLKASQ